MDMTSWTYCTLLNLEAQSSCAKKIDNKIIKLVLIKAIYASAYEKNNKKLSIGAKYQTNKERGYRQNRQINYNDSYYNSKKQINPKTDKKSAI